MANRNTHETVTKIAEMISDMSRDQIKALKSVRAAARRGATVAMQPDAREELQLGMVAFDVIIEATGVL